MQQDTGCLVTPNFSEVTDKVGPGIYKARIIDSKVDTWAGRDGKPNTTYIGWTLETFGETEDKNNGRRIFHNTPIEGKGAFRLQDFYRAATGLECTGEFDRTMLHGTEVELTIAPQAAKPEYNEVKAVKPIRNH
jgi:hypothetical protein